MAAHMFGFFLNGLRATCNFGGWPLGSIGAFQMGIGIHQISEWRATLEKANGFRWPFKMNQCSPMVIQYYSFQHVFSNSPCRNKMKEDAVQTISIQYTYEILLIFKANSCWANGKQSSKRRWGWGMGRAGKGQGAGKERWIEFAFLLLPAHVYMTFKTELKLYHQQLEATRITKAIKAEG